MGNTPAGRHLQDICTFGRVGLHTSRGAARQTRRHHWNGHANLHDRGVAGQLPRPARRSKKGPVRRGLRGRAARGGVLWPHFTPVLQLYIILDT